MNTIELQPEELFFLAQQMKAEYIDYMYISAMKDISKKFALHHKEWIDSLEKRNVICEDFDGNISIDLDVENALNLCSSVKQRFLLAFVMLIRV